MTGNLTSFAAAVASTDGGVRISTRDKERMTVFHKRKAPNEPFTHSPGCRIVAVDPGVQIPWSEIRRGVWEAVCVCGKQYHHDPVVDDRVRNDPLKIVTAARLSASSAARPIPLCSGSP